MNDNVHPDGAAAPSGGSGDVRHRFTHGGSIDAARFHVVLPEKMPEYHDLTDIKIDDRMNIIVHVGANEYINVWYKVQNLVRSLSEVTLPLRRLDGPVFDAMRVVSSSFEGAPVFKHPIPTTAFLQYLET